MCRYDAWRSPMKKTSFFRSLLLGSPLLRSAAVTVGAALIALASTGCNNPEDFCAGWVADQCEVLAGCCKTGAKFDLQGCIVGLSDQCQDFVEVEEVHAGEVEFDSGAASTCLGVVETCDTAEATPEEAFDRQSRARTSSPVPPAGRGMQQRLAVESTGSSRRLGGRGTTASAPRRVRATLRAGSPSRRTSSSTAPSRSTRHEEFTPKRPTRRASARSSSRASASRTSQRRRLLRPERDQPEVLPCKTASTAHLERDER